MGLTTGSGRSGAISKLSEQNRRVRNVVILACAVDAADKALLPATFKALAEQVDAGPVRLGALAFAQSISFSLALPVWGSMMYYRSSRELLAMGCVLWGLATLLLAMASSYEVHFCLRLLVGAALAVVSPIGQAVICDVVPEEERGWAFGVLSSASHGLTMLVSFWATWVATSTVFGFQGWRVAHAFVAAMSLVIGMLVWKVVPESPPVGTKRTWLAEQRRVLSAVAGKPSFAIMVAQGVVGAIPWNAFAFLTFFFQLSGYTDWEAGEIGLLSNLGGVVGGVLGGWLGDAFARVSPYAGRCGVAQASVFLGTVTFLCMIYIPYGRNSLLAICAVSLAFRAVAGWTPTAALRPICGAIFQDSQDRAQVLALWMALEGVISSICGAPLAGLLCEWFGYSASQHGHDVGSLSPEERAQSLQALRSALLGVSLLPWTLCFLAWVPMYWTYPRDHQQTASTQTRDLGDYAAVPTRFGGSDPTVLRERSRERDGSQ